MTVRLYAIDDAVWVDQKLRTDDGYRILITPSEPGPDGFCTLTMVVDYSDRLPVGERGEDYGSDS